MSFVCKFACRKRALSSRGEAFGGLPLRDLFSKLVTQRRRVRLMNEVIVDRACLLLRTIETYCMNRALILCCFQIKVSWLLRLRASTPAQS